MTRFPWTPAALLAAAVVLTLPLPTTGQTPAQAPSGPWGPWTTSPLERVLDRAEALELTAGQTERLTAALEAWRAAARDPLARVEALSAQRRAAMEATREERMEARRHRMEERRDAMADTPEGVRPGRPLPDSLRADSLRQGRRGMVRSRALPPRGTRERSPGTGLEPEARAEFRVAMTDLRELRQEQMTLLREVLSEEQLRALRTDVASRWEMRRGRGGTLRPEGPRFRPDGPRLRPGRGGERPSGGVPHR